MAGARASARAPAAAAGSGSGSGSGSGNIRWALGLRHAGDLLFRAGFHKQNLEVVRGGALQPRAARRLCQLEQRHWLLYAAPHHRPNRGHAAMRPGGFYGPSKAFCENLAQLHYDRWDIETVSLRIGSSFREPVDRRMRACDDLERLVRAALTAPHVGHSVIYGVSDNPRRCWNNDSASHFGFRAHERSERFTATVEVRTPPGEPASPVVRYHGDNFVAEGPYE